MDPDDAAGLLGRVAAERRLTEVTLQSCRLALENAQAESEANGESFCGGYTSAELLVTWRKHALVFSSSVLREPYIESTVEIALHDSTGVYFQGRRPIGSYRLITRLATGDVADDYLEWLVAPDGRKEYEREWGSRTRR